MTMDTMRSQRPSDEGADGPVPPVRAARRPPRIVAAASVTMKVIGIAVIAIGLGLLLAVAIGDWGSTACGEDKCVKGFMAPLGYVLLTAGIVEIVAAVQVRSGKAWAWLVGVVLGLVGPPLGLLVSQHTGDREIVIGLVFLVPNVFVVVALLTSRHWFAPNGSLK